MDIIRDDDPQPLKTLSNWLRRAKDRDVIIYAQDIDFIADDPPAVFQKVRELYVNGVVQMFQVKSPSGEGHSYLAMRTMPRTDFIFQAITSHMRRHPHGR